jgi:hypothetical protein
VGRGLGVGGGGVGVGFTTASAIAGLGDGAADVAPPPMMVGVRLSVAVSGIAARGMAVAVIPGVLNGDRAATGGVVAVGDKNGTGEAVGLRRDRKEPGHVQVIKRNEIRRRMPGVCIRIG